MMAGNIPYADAVKGSGGNRSNWIQTPWQEVTFTYLQKGNDVTRIAFQDLEEKFKLQFLLTSHVDAILEIQRNYGFFFQIKRPGVISVINNLDHNPDFFRDALRSYLRKIRIFNIVLRSEEAKTVTIPPTPPRNLCNSSVVVIKGYEVFVCLADKESTMNELLEAVGYTDIEHVDISLIQENLKDLGIEKEARDLDYKLKTIMIDTSANICKFIWNAYRRQHGMTLIQIFLSKCNTTVIQFDTRDISWTKHAFPLIFPNQDVKNSSFVKYIKSKCSERLSHVTAFSLIGDTDGRICVVQRRKTSPELEKIIRNSLCFHKARRYVFGTEAFKQTVAKKLETVWFDIENEFVVCTDDLNESLSLLISTLELLNKQLSYTHEYYIESEPDVSKRAKGVLPNAAPTYSVSSQASQAAVETQQETQNTLTYTTPSQQSSVTVASQIGKNIGKCHGTYNSLLNEYPVTDEQKQVNGTALVSTTSSSSSTVFSASDNGHTLQGDNAAYKGSEKSSSPSNVYYTIDQDNETTKGTVTHNYSFKRLPASGMNAKDVFAMSTTQIPKDEHTINSQPLTGNLTMFESSTKEQKLENEKMKTMTVECGLCFAEEVVGICENCECKLCETCFTYHTRAKMFRAHIIFPIEDANKTTIMSNFKTALSTDTGVKSPVDTDIHKQTCKEHSDENQSFYCEKHDACICGRCVISNHASCLDSVVDLNNIMHDAKNAHKSLSTLKELDDEIDRIMVNIDENRRVNDACRSSSAKEINKLYIELVDKLKLLITKAEKESDELHKQNADILDETELKCKEQKHVLRKQMELLDALQNKKHYRHLFVALTRNEKTIDFVKDNNARCRQETNIKEYDFVRNLKLVELIKEDQNIGTFTTACDGSDEVMGYIYEADSEHKTNEKTEP